MYLTIVLFSGEEVYFFTHSFCSLAEDHSRSIDPVSFSYPDTWAKTALAARAARVSRKLAK